MLAFEFPALTAARSGEVRNARWEEFDREGAVWTIPAERMKAGANTARPLSPRALAVLDEARRLPFGAGTVFPSPTGRTQPHHYMARLLPTRDVGLVQPGHPHWRPDYGESRLAAWEKRAMTDPQLFSIIGSVLGVGIALAALIIGLIAWLRADMKTDRAEAAQDRRAFQQSMDGFRAEMRTFQTEMQRLAERQSHLEGARTAAGD